MTYKVRFIETIIKIIEVEADSVDEAYDIAEELFESGEVEMEHNFDSCETEWTVL